MVPRRAITFLLMLFFTGCSSASPSPTPAPASETPPPPPTATSAPDYVTLLRAAEYQLGGIDALRTVQLTDGVYQNGQPGDSDYAFVKMTDFTAKGDLNGDGRDEYVALVGENYGGSGTFVFIALFNEVGGRMVFQASRIVDDRPQINGLLIENGEVLLDAVIHGAEDPFCCPTLKTVRHYDLFSDGQLELSDYSTFTPDDRQRTIKLELPASGTEVTSSVQVRGTVTIAPFENNLVYKLVSTGGVELSVGSITVSASELGGPGAFDTVIVVRNVLAGSLVRLVVQDVSAADGSVLAMDSVELVVK